MGRVENDRRIWEFDQWGRVTGDTVREGTSMGILGGKKPKKRAISEGSTVARHLAPQNISPLRKAMKKQLVTLKQANSSRKRLGDEILPAFAAVRPVTVRPVTVLPVAVPPVARNSNRS